MKFITTLIKEELIPFMLVLIIVLTTMYSVYNSAIHKEIDDSQRTTPTFCSTSKVRGSNPVCWDENDWKVFCQHVECKTKF